MFFLIGSVSNPVDLTNARADIAVAMFFICNAETSFADSYLEDAGTVLRQLSVSNFNNGLQCFVQVLRAEDRDILQVLSQYYLSTSSVLAQY